MVGGGSGGGGRCSDDDECRLLKGILYRCCVELKTFDTVHFRSIRAVSSSILSFHFDLNISKVFASMEFAA